MCTSVSSADLPHKMPSNETVAYQVGFHHINIVPDESHRIKHFKRPSLL
jgi:hypothetical protein